MAQMPTAVVLLSGGLDSATALAVAKADGFEAHALTVSYGQRHAVELKAARRVAEAGWIGGLGRRLAAPWGHHLRRAAMWIASANYL